MKRRIISIMLCVALLVPVMCVSGVTATAAKKGDMDGDGTVTVADALAALRIGAKLVSATTADIAAGDIDKDGAVTVADALAILRVAAKLATFEEDPELPDFHVGDYVKFGRYEQDNSDADGPEPIDWLVLKVESDKILLISRYVLDYERYQAEECEISWGECSLRNYLNNTFMNEAFSSEEYALIQYSRATADRNTYWESTPQGTGPRDKIFLLSEQEARNTSFFPNDELRQCIPTTFARFKGAPDGYCEWWLRTMGKDTYHAAVVDETGSIWPNGWQVNTAYGVRPCIWVAPEALSVAEGNTVTYGVYEQDNNTKNGKEPIEWTVLKIWEGKACLLSKYALDGRPFHQSATNVTWSGSILRTWLNGAFYTNAFTAKEKFYIREQVVYPYNNPRYDTDGGDPCKDNVFLLSIDDAVACSAEVKRCIPTAYAKAQGVQANSSGYCEWWLRTPGETQKKASYMDNTGSVSYAGAPVYNGFSVVSDTHGVRPCIWVSLDNLFR